MKDSFLDEFASMTVKFKKAEPRSRKAEPRSRKASLKLKLDKCAHKIWKWLFATCLKTTFESADSLLSYPYPYHAPVNPTNLVAG